MGVGDYWPRDWSHRDEAAYVCKQHYNDRLAIQQSAANARHTRSAGNQPLHQPRTKAALRPEAERLVWEPEVTAPESDGSGEEAMMPPGTPALHGRRMLPDSSAAAASPASPVAPAEPLVAHVGLCSSPAASVGDERRPKRLRTGTSEESEDPDL